MTPDSGNHIVERLMEGLEPPPPPPELRAKTLAAARERLTGETVMDPWLRIWKDRRLRLAWAATVVLLLGGHVLATLSPAGSPSSIDPALSAETRVDENFVGMLRPIRISENAQPLVGLFAGGDSPIELDLEGNS